MQLECGQATPSRVQSPMKRIKRPHPESQDKGRRTAHCSDTSCPVLRRFTAMRLGFIDAASGCSQLPRPSITPSPPTSKRTPCHDSPHVPPPAVSVHRCPTCRACQPKHSFQFRPATLKLERMRGESPHPTSKDLGELTHVAANSKTPITICCSRIHTFIPRY